MWGLAQVFLEFSADEVVEELIAASELDVGADHDGVPALHEGVLEFGECDGGAFGVAFAEVIAFEEAGDGDAGVEAEDVGVGEFVEPFGVAPDFSACGVEDFEDLVGVGFGIMFNFFWFEGYAGFAAACGVANTCGVIADNDDGEVSGILELADFVEDDGVAEVEVGRGGVEAQLDAQRAAFSEFGGKFV